MANKEFDNVQLFAEYDSTVGSNVVNVFGNKSKENIAYSLSKIKNWFPWLIPTNGSAGQILEWYNNVPTWRANTNADTVKQTHSTDTDFHPLVLGAPHSASTWSSAISETTDQVYMNKGVYVKPSTSTIYATEFVGKVTHPTIPGTGDDTTSSVTPLHGQGFTTVDVVTRDSNGHVIGINTKTVTLPAQYVHPTYTRTDTTSTASPPHGGTFTAIDSVSSTNGHVTAVNLKTVTLPAQYVHPTYIDKDTANFYKVKITNGHISEATAIAKGDVSTFLNLLDTGSSTPTDADYYISQYVGGGTTTTSYHRRPMSALWSYIKGKADPIYAPLTHTHDYLPLAGGTMSGTINHPANTVAINLRTDDTSTWQNTIMTQSAGDEAVVFANANARTSWMFVNGEDSIANHENNRWQSLTPALQIKGGCVAIGKLIPSGTTPTTKLDVNGDTSISGTLMLTNATDAAGTANNKPALIVGGTDTTGHLELDSNEIMAKSNGVTPAALYINDNGGTVYVNNKVVAKLTSTPTSGQILIADGTDGNIKTSGYTIAQSVYSTSKLTDENVEQTVTTSANSSYRPLLIGASWFDEGGAPSTVTDTVMASHRCYIQPNTGDITLYSPSGDSPGLIFKRGTNTDNLNDWKIYDKSGSLYFARNVTGSSAWTDYIHFDGSNIYSGSNLVLTTAGGTISTSSYATQLTIKRSGSANYAVIGFENSNGMLGYIGMSGTANGGLYRGNTDRNTFYKIYDSENMVLNVWTSAAGATSATLNQEIPSTHKILRITMGEYGQSQKSVVHIRVGESISGALIQTDPNYQTAEGSIDGCVVGLTFTQSTIAAGGTGSSETRIVLTCYASKGFNLSTGAHYANEYRMFRVEAIP